MNSPTLDTLERAFSPTLHGLGFREVMREESCIFDNAYAVHEKDGLRIRLVSDRGHPYVDVGSVHDPDKWYDLALIRNHLDNRDIVETPSMPELASFLSREYALLIGMFTTKFAETVKLVQSLQQESALRTFSDNMVGDH